MRVQCPANKGFRSPKPNGLSHTGPKSQKGPPDTVRFCEVWQLKYIIPKNRPLRIPPGTPMPEHGRVKHRIPLRSRRLYG